MMVTMDVESDLAVRCQSLNTLSKNKLLTGINIFWLLWP